MPQQLADVSDYSRSDILLLERGLLEVSDPELECTRCADDAVLEHYWKDLYKYPT